MWRVERIKEDVTLNAQNKMDVYRRYKCQDADRLSHFYAARCLFTIVFNIIMQEIRSKPQSCKRESQGRSNKLGTAQSFRRTSSLSQAFCETTHSASLI